MNGPISLRAAGLLFVLAIPACANREAPFPHREVEPVRSSVPQAAAPISEATPPVVRLWDPLADDTGPLSEMTRSVVTLEGLGEGGEVVGTGTAFFVSGDRVATAWHVLRGARTARIRFASGTVAPVTGVAYTDWERDLALLVVRVEGVPPVCLPLSADSAREGDRVIVVGSAVPGDPLCAASYGRIMNWTEAGAGQPQSLSVRVVTAPGWSGSPVLTPKSEVVGVARAGLGGAYTLAIPAGAVRVALRESDGREAVSIHSLSPRGAFGQSRSRDGVRRTLPPHLAPIAASLARNDLAAAERTVRTVLEASPRDAEAWECLAVLLTMQSRHREAQDAMRELLKLRPESADIHYMLGNSLLGTREYAGAAEAFRDAVRLSARDADAHYGLGYALLLSGSFESSIECFKTVLDIDPSYSAAREGLRAAEARRDRSR